MTTTSPTALPPRGGSPAPSTGFPIPRPDDGTTRYLCAAAQRYQDFSDEAIAEFLGETVRAVPPSPGLDAAAVLREAVAARTRRRIRDTVLAALCFLVVVANPVAVPLWLLVTSVVSRRRLPTWDPARRAMAVLVPVVALALLAGVFLTGWWCGAWWPAGTWSAPVSTVLATLTYAVLVADEHLVQWLIRVRFRPGVFQPDHHHAGSTLERRVRGWGPAVYAGQIERVAAADEYGPEAAGRADVIVHRGTSPFVGAGLALETQGISMPLEPSTSGGRPGGPAKISVVDLHEHVAAALTSLSANSSLTPGMRLDGILRREQVLIPAEQLVRNLDSSLGAAALKALDRAPARHVALRAARSLAERPLGWARYYNCYRVESWSRDLVTSCYLYVGADQGLLYLELTHCVLPPLAQRLQEIDYVVQVGTGPLSTSSLSFLMLPRSAGRRIRSLFRRLTPRHRVTRGVVAEQYGVGRSLREHFAGGRPADHFLKSDVARYIKIVDTCLFRAVGKYLEQCGYDVVEFQKEARNTINQNYLNISGGSFVGTVVAAGNGNQNTVTNDPGQ